MRADLVDLGKHHYSGAVPDPSPTALPSRPLVAVVVLCFGGLCAALTQTFVIPIQTQLPLLLHTSAANAAWVVTVTLLAAAVSMPIAGRLADLFGKQRVLVATSAFLLVGSLVCALSDTLAPVLVGRALQAWRWASSRSAFR